ncbi:hypothetical protein, partial [Corallococcus sp. AB049A]|uniref:hypothetical protein n=1 Tax=Corallococcus sp. AB049A TaxID=2316721 RepID=UPI001315275F
LAPGDRPPAWRLVGPPTVPTVGADAGARLAPALAAHGIDVVVEPPDRADRPDPGQGPSTEGARPVTLGWEAHMVPLRPAHADRHAVRDALAGASGRQFRWAIVDHVDPGWSGDGGPAALLAAATAALGPSTGYLGGVAWADN